MAPMPGRRVLLACAVGLAFLAARGPLLRATWGLPLSNDDALALLMARHILRGELVTTFWNAPYNGALDSYLLAGGLVVASPHALFRTYQAASGAALVILVGLLARSLGGGLAGWAAALLAAVGSPYVALVAATGSTPTILVPVLVSLPALAGLHALNGVLPSPAISALLGLVSGLAVWDSAVALPSLAGIGLGLALAGLRPGPRCLAFAAGFGLGLVPALVGRAVAAAGASNVTALRPAWLWAAAPEDLMRASAGLLGLSVPVVADGPVRIPLPLVLRLCLLAALLALVWLGARSRAARPLLAWTFMVAAAFVLSGRARGDRVRYLLPLIVPVLALAGAGAARVFSRRPTAAVLLGLGALVPWAYGHRALALVWRDPRHAVRLWGVPPLEETLHALQRAGVRSVYASLQFAGRLSLESGSEVLASQAWNERFPGDPLRFRDEVDLDPRAAWALAPEISRGMPRGAGFRDILRDLGGTWEEEDTGPLVIFRDFKPPYDEARPVATESLSISTLEGSPLPASVLDRDASTAWASPRETGPGTGLAVRVAPPRALSALVLAVDLERSPLGIPWECRIGGASPTHGPRRHAMQWVNGAPRAGKQALLVILLGGEAVGEVRLMFRGEGPPLVVREVFLYGPEEPPQEPAGAEAAARAFDRAREGDWAAAVALYAEAVRLEPHRSSHHAALLRARGRAGRRGFDVESLDDGGSEVVGVRAESP